MSGTFKKYTGDDLYIVLPSEINGKEVKSIGEAAFFTEGSSLDLIRIDLPSSITAIDKNAFRQNQQLRFMAFSDKLETIGARAFEMTALHNVELPPSLKEMGEGAFAGVFAQVVKISEGLKILPSAAFRGAWIEEIYLPSSLEKVEDGALALTTKLNFISFAGNLIPEMSQRTFYEKPENIVSFNIPLQDIDIAWNASKEDAANTKEKFISYGFPEESFIVWRADRPDGADFPSADSKLRIDDESGLINFYEGKDQELTMHYSFYAADKTTVGSVTGLGGGVFENAAIKKFYVPHNETFKVIGDRAFANSQLEYFDFFDTVETIGSQAFMGCSNLKEITIPKEVTSIGSGAFADCKNLETVLFEGKSIIIGDGAFSETTNLKKLILLGTIQLQGTLGANLEAIRFNDVATVSEVEASKAQLALPWYMSKLKADDEFSFEPMPHNKTSDASNFDFDNSTGKIIKYKGNEKEVIIPTQIDGVDVKIIGEYSMTDFFGDENVVKKVVIPHTVRIIEQNAFAQNQSTEFIEIYGPIEKVGDGGFTNCVKLKELKFINGVKELSFGAFADNANMKNIVLGNSLDSIPERSFADSGVAGVLELDVDAIDKTAFLGCTNLTEIRLGKRVSSIGNGAFQGLQSLKKVYITNLDPTVYQDFSSKFDNKDTYKVVLPDSATDAEIASFVDLLNSYQMDGKKMVVKE